MRAREGDQPWWALVLTFLILAWMAAMGTAGGAVPTELVERRDRVDPAPALVVSLRSESTVRGPEIRLGDIAEIRGQDTGLVERLRGVEVGRAPLPGLRRIVDLPYLKARLRLQQIDTGSLLFDVPPAIAVTTASQRVSGADLLAVVREHILAAASLADRSAPTDPAHLSIQPAATLSDLVLPAGILELKVRPRPGAELIGAFAVTVEAWVDGILVRTMSVPVRGSALFEVLVAARPIGRHALIGAADVRLERRELTAGQEPIRELAAVLGRRAVRGISPGEIMLAALVELPPLVRRGEIVLLRAEGRGLRASTPGEAREEGKAGQVVRVRNLASGREVYGEVVGDRVVRVPF